MINIKSSIQLFLIIATLLFTVYLLLPPPPFPAQIPGSLKSTEPADTEDPVRQGFYTDWDRPQIMAYFKSQFAKSAFKGLPLPTLNLNYPPEDAQTIIKDQTQSRYLEEFAHPFRESLFVNGFFAQKDSEVMIVGGHQYQTKVIIRYYPSNPILRLVINLLAILLLVKTTLYLKSGLVKLIHD